MHDRMPRCICVTLLLSTVVSLPVQADTVTTNTDLTEDQVQKVKAIFASDELLSGLVKAQAGLNALNELLKIVTPGPAKLSLQWNQARIDAWKKINGKLAEINKRATCDAIALETLDATDPGYEFFRKLSEERGCD